MAQEVKNGGVEKATVTFTAVKPQLFVEAPKASDAVQFYKAAFGAEELSRTLHAKRKADQELPLILSAELKLGSSVVLVSDFADDSVTSARAKVEGSGFVICLETEDVEAAIAKAVTAGAVKEGESSPTEGEGEGACCGGLVGKLKDPYGFVWLICSPAKKCAGLDA